MNLDSAQQYIWTLSYFRFRPEVRLAVDVRGQAAAEHLRGRLLARQDSRLRCSAGIRRRLVWDFWCHKSYSVKFAAVVDVGSRFKR